MRTILTFVYDDLPVFLFFVGFGFPTRVHTYTHIYIYMSILIYTYAYAHGGMYGKSSLTLLARTFFEFWI